MHLCMNHSREQWLSEDFSGNPQGQFWAKLRSFGTGMFSVGMSVMVSLDKR